MPRPSEVLATPLLLSHVKAPMATHYQRYHLRHHHWIQHLNHFRIDLPLSASQQGMGRNHCQRVLYQSRCSVHCTSRHKHCHRRVAPATSHPDGLAAPNAPRAEVWASVNFRYRIFVSLVVSCAIGC
jgi:hypothetical protein